jgi:integrase
MRISEALALRWGNVELDTGPEIRVRERYYRGDTGDPKTPAGWRDIKIPPSLAAALRRRRAESEWCRDEDLVFPNAAGDPLIANNLRKRLMRPVFAEAGVSVEQPFHVLRHTACSLMLRGGLSRKQTQEILGHGSGRMIDAIYEHLLPGDEGMALDLSNGASSNGNGNGHVEVPDTVPAELVEGS